jgi:hypothetical protein
MFTNRQTPPGLLFSFLEALCGHPQESGVSLS